MNWDQIQGQWKDMTGHLKAKWGKLTDDDVTTVGGKKDQLVGKLQERYGIVKDEAERQVDEWLQKLTPNQQKGSSQTNNTMSGR